MLWYYLTGLGFAVTLCTILYFLWREDSRLGGYYQRHSGWTYLGAGSLVTAFSFLAWPLWIIIFFIVIIRTGGGTRG